MSGTGQIVQFFFFGEYYYAYFMQEHLRAIQSLDKALRSPEAKSWIEGIELPPG